MDSTHRIQPDSDPHEPQHPQEQPEAIAPVYWHNESSPSPLAKRRSQGFRHHLISLQDNDDSSSPTSPSSPFRASPTQQHSPCWAKSATVPSYTIVGISILGSHGPGSYVVFTCVIDIISGSPITIRKRYSEFDALRNHLLRTFPKSAQALPALPRKTMVRKFEEQFLEERRKRLEWFLHWVVTNPDVCGSPVVKGWVFDT